MINNEPKRNLLVNWVDSLAVLSWDVWVFFIRLLDLGKQLCGSLKKYRLLTFFRKISCVCVFVCVHMYWKMQRRKDQ